ncbi:MAG: PSD1 domain-containing protein [Planctomycetaceae bacterium]|nr:PSD1 domain-containing protein [Planctomycetaceae bacterium]
MPARSLPGLIGHCAAAVCAAWGIALSAAGLLAEEPTATPAPANGAVDFVRDIRPLLAASCFKCHGPEKQESGLRLDVRDSALQGGDGGAVLVAGKSGESRLVQYISGDDPEHVMPPEGEGDRLTAEQVALVRRWVDAGLSWPAEAAGAERVHSSHWAYQPPQRAPLPTVARPHWPRNAIDYFILARLESEGLAPAPEAERGPLLRRLSLDLTGLPPTAAELDDYLLDSRADAHEQQIERLLASPAQGERWTRVWLDLARYADTNGYEKDDRRTMWRYRDWVIDAFTRHMPFDQFTIEQLAGDLLPNPTLEQRIATGFHRNTMNNTEGGTDDEEFRVAAVVDRVNTTMTVWMGTTMACAQCHTHKYDPFTQREYFQLFAIFNNTADTDTNDLAPTIEAPTPEMVAETARLRAEMAAVRQVLDTATPELAVAQQRWEEQTRAQQAGWQVLEPIEVAAEQGSTLTIGSDRSVLAGGETPAQETYTVAVATELQGITAFRLEALPDDSLPQKGPGRAEGNFVLSELRVVHVQPATEGAPAVETPIKLKNPTARHAQDKFPIKHVLDEKDDTGWGIAPQTGQAQEAVFVVAKPLRTDGAVSLKFALAHRSPHERHLLGRFRLAATTAAEPPAANSIPRDMLTILEKGIDARTPDESQTLAAYYRTIAPELAAQREQFAKLEAAIPKPPTAPVLVELDQPRTTRMHIRGSFLNQGDEVQPQTPAVLHPLPPDQPRNRLTFARWLVDRQNPLTARVVVNRIWEQYFGIGLVRTSEDFGTRGEAPSHPELLDWLAVELMEQGWDLRVLHRLITGSATYRQQSRATPELLARDPENRLLARGPRVRLDAEQIRDQALALSGLLNATRGGPSVMPPQPEGVWNMPYSSDTWRNATGGDRYRRAIYTFWRRTAPYPAFSSFDAPSRELCVVRRPRTNTPLQALTVLNDPAYVECAQALARRGLLEPESGADLPARLRYLFRLCLARDPGADESAQLAALWRDARDHFAADPTAAARLVSRESEAAAATESANGPALDPVDWAAWTVVANVLLNLDELITKG